MCIRDRDRSGHALWAKHLNNLLVDFLGAEWLVDGAYRIDPVSYTHLIWCLRCKCEELDEETNVSSGEL